MKPSIYWTVFDLKRVWKSWLSRMSANVCKRQEGTGKGVARHELIELKNKFNWFKFIWIAKFSWKVNYLKILCFNLNLGTEWVIVMLHFSSKFYCFRIWSGKVRLKCQSDGQGGQGERKLWRRGHPALAIFILWGHTPAYMHLLKAVFRNGPTIWDPFLRTATSMPSVPTDFLFFDVEMCFKTSSSVTGRSNFEI